MKFTSALLFLVCTPYAVHCLQVKSGSSLTGTVKDKARMLAEEISGQGVTVLDAIFDLCDDDQIGLFTDAGTELGMGFENGIVLSSGFAVDAAGLNDNQYEGDALHHLGYAALDTLLAPNGGATKDACALHITFKCQDDDHFGMKFVFGSDNYNCPVHPPYYSPYEDVMGIFVGDDKTLAPKYNIGLFNGKYISVDTFTKGSAPNNYVDNCLGNIAVEMNGYSYPITISNDLNKVKTGQNELWIAVADGYDLSDPNTQNHVKKPTFVFVRRNSLVCIDEVAASVTKPPTTPPPTTTTTNNNNNNNNKKVKTGLRKCARDALAKCACGDWSCLDHHIQTACKHPGNTKADHHNYKRSVHQKIKRICNNL